MAAGAHGDDVARRADPGIHNRHVHRAGREIAECARQPEAGLRRPVHDDLVSEIDHARLREALQNAALDDTDERSLVAEVGRYGDDSTGPGVCGIAAHAARGALAPATSAARIASDAAPTALGAGAAAVGVRHRAQA